jgi:antitoxin component YwqK of YwqJK toxin-antitoxin module
MNKSLHFPHFNTFAFYQSNHMIQKLIQIQNFLTLCVISLSLFSYSQTNQVTINGNQYFVYPHQKEVRVMIEYYYLFADSKEVIKRDDRNEKIVSIKEEAITEKEKKSVPRFSKATKKQLKEFEEILEKYPHLFVRASYSISEDPTPALQNLPDGNYVMYYRDIPFISKRVIHFKNDQVAAFFSIKNNHIEGKSEWFNPEGKLVMLGNYSMSEKSGVWKEYAFQQKADQTVKYDPNQSIEERLKNVLYDTTITTTHFINGLKNGPYSIFENQELLTSGNYIQDQRSGSWEYYEFKKTISVTKKGELLVTKSKDKILIDRYTLRSDQTRGKSPMIRHHVIPSNYFSYGRKDSLILQNTYSSNDYLNYDGYAMEFPDFSNFYTLIDHKDTSNYELPEENLTSYEGQDYYEDEDLYFGDEFGSENPNPDYNPNEFYQFVNKKRYKVNELIDSIGYLFEYEGIVEHYYPNGQLQYKFEVKDGLLLKEEPVYWDNGTVANEIIFVSDSNQYVQRFYDYNGIKYFESWHDAKGNVLGDLEQDESSFVQINQKKYDRNYGQPTFIHSDSKAIKMGQLPEKILLIQELFKVDSSLAKEVYFYPSSRSVVTVGWNLMGDTIYHQEATFSEDYLNVNALSSTKFKNLEYKVVENGTLDEYWKNTMSDTIPIEKMVFYWEYKYLTESDNELLVDGKKFTGNFTVNDKTGSFKLKASKESIQLTLPKSPTDLKLYNSALKNYSKSKKRTDLLIGYVSDFGGSSQLSHTITRLFPQLYGALQSLYEVQPYELDGKETEYEEEYEIPRRSRTSSKNESVYSTLQGKYLNGKPEGLWTYKDQFGKTRSIIGYKNGLTHGDNLDYSVALPKPKADSEVGEMYERYENPLNQFAEYPEKKMYYLDSKCTFKNGQMDGPFTQHNWKGDTLSYVNFVDGAREGVEYKRNQLFYSQSYYRNGYLDGNVHTYFTYPKKDSVLIFDLSFKNGALQGESVAYHSNGKLAKKGFFLTGQPIDDYEAYDTLGFKYQYVKFQYNQPIEEKIWEENELSVRYEFDWRDSIPFNFGDITESTSIERLIYQAGYSNFGLRAPYYGRPSLVDKSGIDYFITKYYPNDTIARVGAISKGIKVGCWKYFNYEGRKLMEVEYFDTIISINDSIKFKSKGILYYLDKDDNVLSKSWIIEKFEKYDCSHTDHNEERMLYCFWEKDSTQHRKNGYVKNYYDNGNLQNEGWVKNGLPTGVWKMYDVNGNLNQVGQYILGKRDGRWLKGDLGSVKNMSEICLNPNIENLEAILNYQEKLLDVSVITYQVGKELKRKYYGINLNSEEAPEGYFEEEMYYDEY